MFTCGAEGEIERPFTHSFMENDKRQHCTIVHESSYMYTHKVKTNRKQLLLLFASS